MGFTDPERLAVVEKRLARGSKPHCGRQDLLNSDDCRVVIEALRDLRKEVAVLRSALESAACDAGRETVGDYDDYISSARAEVVAEGVG